MTGDEANREFESDLTRRARFATHKRKVASALRDISNNLTKVKKLQLRNEKALRAVKRTVEQIARTKRLTTKAVQRRDRSLAKTDELLKSLKIAADCYFKRKSISQLARPRRSARPKRIK